MKSTRKILLAFVLIVFVLAAIATTAIAQKTVSRAPTAADWAALARLPDFTGVWEISRGGGGGRGVAPAGPALTPEYAAKRDALRASAPEDKETANCLPAGMPAIMGQPYPMEFLMTPGKVTIVIEAYTQVRHIYTDGRPLPEDPDLKFHGTSIGHWEGETLVVETIGFSPLTQLAGGIPHSGNMRIVERLRLTGPDTMSIETTITDPRVLTAPYKTNITLARHRNWTIAEYICEENNRNFVDEKGKAGVILNNPGGLPQKKD
ncbi:MAG TPA: hypothetical protein VE422_04590 [Terriglobia bacterium]|nr:hypothetical protein [Terriglobia bacterium]